MVKESLISRHVRISLYLHCYDLNPNIASTTSDLARDHEVISYGAARRREYLDR